MYYKLNEDKTISHVEDIIEWAKSLEGNDRHVAKDTLEDGTFISTVFLGMDHRFEPFDGPGKPVVFETMVFTIHPLLKEYNDYQERYTNWDEALKGHNKMVELLKSKL